MSATRVARRGRARFSPALKATVHHGSHAGLLDRVRAASVEPANLDVVLVPTCRPVGCLREAARLARDLDCLLVAMCSRSASAAEAATLGEALDADVLAIDTTGLRRLPDLVTTGPPEDPRFARDSDLSLKRNLGLRLARVAGWERVLFLDDDISGAQAADVRAAAGLLRDYRVVGLRNDRKSQGFPDNSVVCHAFREVGGEQGSFIGGGAVVVAPERISSFFPDVYNEDWFVFFGAMPVAVTGRVVHKPYNPFASPVRARAEEFGDCLGEGLFWLLDSVRREELDDAEGDLVAAACSAKHWQSFLQNRRAFLREVLGRLQTWDGDADRRERMIASVDAAQQWNSYVTPGACARYVRRWRNDLVTWRKHRENLPVGLPLGSALKELKLADRAVRSRN